MLWRRKLVLCKNNSDVLPVKSFCKKAASAQMSLVVLNCWSVYKLLLKGRQKPHYQTSVDFVLVFLLFTLIKYLTIDLHIALMFLCCFFDSEHVWWAQQYWEIPFNFLVSFLGQNELAAHVYKKWLVNLVDHSILEKHY